MIVHIAKKSLIFVIWDCDRGRVISGFARFYYKTRVLLLRTADYNQKKLQAEIGIRTPNMLSTHFCFFYSCYTI